MQLGWHYMYTDLFIPFMQITFTITITVHQRSSVPHWKLNTGRQSCQNWMTGFDTNAERNSPLNENTFPALLLYAIYNKLMHIYIVDFVFWLTRPARYRGTVTRYYTVVPRARGTAVASTLARLLPWYCVSSHRFSPSCVVSHYFSLSLAVLRGKNEV